MDELERSKIVLRKEYILKRKNIENKKEKSDQITKKIIENDFYKNAKIVALYKNLTDEVDTNELIKYSIDIGKTVCLPRIVENEIRFYKINDCDEILEKSKFGVEEPIADEDNYIEKNIIDLIIVPGVCFDQNKNRMGFGKGFYDRFLESTSLKSIGICFEEQIVEKLPVTTNDVKMDLIITNKKIYWKFNFTMIIY